MKILNRILLFVIPAGLVLTSCEGPQGPQGIDANQSCTECHDNSAQIETKQAQWEHSLHATGENAAYANRAGCAECHTSQGFLEYVAEGSRANISLPDEPMQINCYTCHEIHTTYTEEDYSLTKPGAETLILKAKDGSTVTWDKGTSNQCVGCHQARNVATIPVQNAATFSITDTRFGPHHAPNSNLMLGKIPFELTGSAAYPTTNPHNLSNACIDCHMSKPYGYMAGGHSMNMFYDAHGVETLNTNACITCHTDATTAKNKFTALQTAVSTKLSKLESQLTAANVYNPTTGLAKAGTTTGNAALAYLCYNTIKEDKSFGMHNPSYTKALLDNAIQAMTALGFPAP
ncbi:MAG TPA: hypothetical protein VK213_10775 [Bacteroidales bacterium]|nr:hypothetical protein [Bacteroidales bacterium]